MGLVGCYGGCYYRVIGRRGSKTSGCIAAGRWCINPTSRRTSVARMRKTIVAVVYGDLGETTELVETMVERDRNEGRRVLLLAVCLVGVAIIVVGIHSFARVY
uniref:Uncharacterized protein n=1 Tax=Vespula pensylvanica TaxID=30213 RepID=A0A834KS91_VESPE|nr:hypothetical protein H0235_014068 [Vespula pensylvanica]